MRYLSLLLSMMIIVSCQAQKPATSQVAPASNSESLLWKVEGNGIKPSYVYGTFHLMPQKDFKISAPVDSAFTTSEKLVLELDLDNPNMQMELMSNMAMKDSVKLSDLVSEEEYQLIAERMLKTAGMPLDMMQTYKPFFISSMLMFDVSGEPLASFEMSFVQMAVEQEKEILGLETVTQQMSIFDSIPYQSQADDLVEMLTDKEEADNLFDEMVKLYQSEDIDGLEEIMRSDVSDPYQYRLLITDRNAQWVSRIHDLASEHSCFIGVGAGHLGGEKGLIPLLKEAGFTVSAVQD